MFAIYVKLNTIYYYNLETIIYKCIIYLKMLLRKELHLRINSIQIIGNMAFLILYLGNTTMNKKEIYR